MSDHAYSANKASKNTKGTECFAINCSEYKNQESRSRGITFHKFPPKTDDRFKLWIKNCRREKAPSQYSLVCSSHFEEKWMDRTGQTVRLRPGAVPTIFSLPERLQPVSKEPRNTTTSKRARETVTCDVDSTSSQQEQHNLHNHDHSYSFDDVDSMRKKMKVLEDRVDFLENKLKRVSARERRLKLRLHDLLASLKEKNLITAELEEKLDLYKDIPVNLLLRPAQEYSEDQKRFALTLHLYSPKAYDYLRTSLSLPSPRTLRRWMEKIDGEPGINKPMMEALRQKLLEKPDEYTHCCLTLDAMHIRKQLLFDSHKQQTVGYVDVGSGPEEGGHLASEALVFMLVGLKAHWKCPVAYYFTKGLSSDSQQELLKHCLETLTEIGLKVHCLTMDGHASNMGMAASLGASMHTDAGLRPYFNITGSDVNTYVLLDPCHMLKLMRNLLEAYGSIKSSKGTVTWNFIKDLHTLQDDLGLRLANKLGARHIFFQQQKMKVSLAAQTLSSSVADALETLRSLGIPKFQDCGATVDFIRTYLCDWFGCCH